MSEVLVLGELKEGKLEKKVLELVEVAKCIASKLHSEISIALLGSNLSEAVTQAACYGADKVYKIEHPLLNDYRPELWVESLEWLCRDSKPSVVILSHDVLAIEVAPKLAYRLGTVLTTDCVGLDVDSEDGLLIRTKPIYGGNAIAIFKCTGEPQMVTVRKGTFKPAEVTENKARIIDFHPELNEDMIKIQSIQKLKREAIELDKADVIVSGGRGISERDDFQMLEDLARVLSKRFGNVVVGCSRPVVDKGWMPSEHQVGLTGSIVAPNIYIAIGISGAMQHLVGMIRSKKVITINTDPACNMFRVSDWGVVEDYKDILPSLIKRLEELS